MLGSLIEYVFKCRSVGGYIHIADTDSTVRRREIFIHSDIKLTIPNEKFELARFLYWEYFDKI